MILNLQASKSLLSFGRNNSRPFVQLGLSLVELMISMTIGLLLVWAMGAIYAASSQAFRVQEDNARIQENGRYVLEILGRSFRQAGYGDIPFAGIKVAFTGIPISGTDGAVGVADTVTVQYDGVIGDRDCEGNQVTVASPIIQNHFNLDAPNAMLRCAGAIAATPAAPGATPTGQVLLDNVEDLQILYGIDSDGDQSVNQYVSAITPANRVQVISVRACALIRSEKTGIVSAGSGYLNCNGASVTTPADRRLRRAFTATFNLRNRVSNLP